MSSPAPAPAPAEKKSGWFKAILLGMLGLGGGAAGTYATAVVDRVVKPTKPVANFAVTNDGLSVTCQNHASGESGWWDFGDGTPLEPFSLDQPATHTYAKPGNYTVKLIVRNYLGDENERSVPVEVAIAAKDSTPKIAAFAVQPVSAVSIAPATFRLVAEVNQADACVWDLGDGRVEVTGGGKIDRLVTFEKPGTFPISLVAHNGKQAAKQMAPAPVKVDAPRDGTTMVILKVTDRGSSVDRAVTTESLAVSMPADKAPRTFSKPLTARPGYTIADATMVDSPASIKNLKVQVAADKRSATVTGEWSSDAKANNKAAGGSDALVRLKFTQERVIQQPASVTMVTGTFAVVGSSVRTDLPLPPAPLGVTNAKRELSLEIRSVRAGQATTVAQAPQAGKGSLTFPWQAVQQGQGWSVEYRAIQEGQFVVVTALTKQ